MSGVMFIWTMIVLSPVSMVRLRVAAWQGRVIMKKNRMVSVFDIGDMVFPFLFVCPSPTCTYVLLKILIQEEGRKIV